MVEVISVFVVRADGQLFTTLPYICIFLWPVTEGTPCLALGKSADWTGSSSPNPIFGSRPCNGEPIIIALGTAIGSIGALNPKEKLDLGAIPI